MQTTRKQKARTRAIPGSMTRFRFEQNFNQDPA
jgi:hypothetical protein